MTTTLLSLDDGITCLSLAPELGGSIVNWSVTATGQALLSEDVGNPNLEAENARSFGGGVVFQPSNAIELLVDYWNIRHENLVGIDEDDFIRRALAGENVLTVMPTVEAAATAVALQLVRRTQPLLWVRPMRCGSGVPWMP